MSSATAPDPLTQIRTFFAEKPVEVTKCSLIKQHALRGEAGRLIAVITAGWRASPPAFAFTPAANRALECICR
jgi:hypothetical protein